MPEKQAERVLAALLKAWGDASVISTKASARTPPLRRRPFAFCPLQNSRLPLSQNNIHRFRAAQAADLRLRRISESNEFKLISQTLHRYFAF